MCLQTFCGTTYEKNGKFFTWIKYRQMKSRGVQLRTRIASVLLVITSKLVSLPMPFSICSNFCDLNEFEIYLSIGYLEEN